VRRSGAETDQRQLERLGVAFLIRALVVDVRPAARRVHRRAGSLGVPPSWPTGAPLRVGLAPLRSVRRPPYPPEHMFLIPSRLREWLHCVDHAVEELLAGDMVDWRANACNGFSRVPINAPRHSRGAVREHASATALPGGPASQVPPPATFAGAQRALSSSSRAERPVTATPDAHRRVVARRPHPRRPGALAPPPMPCLSPLPVPRDCGDSRA
jgi:hypothetical protein